MTPRRKPAARFIRPLIQRMHPYVPGEQPRIKGLIKLNTNENPYPPAPQVLKAIRGAVDSRLRLYPNPTAQLLREKLARFHGCKPENIIAGNGSDELLAMAVRAFVEPKAPGPTRKELDSKSKVQFFHPSYSLYPVLAAIHGANIQAVELEADFGLPSVRSLKAGSKWDFNAALTFITTPNAPSGRGYRTAQLREICGAQRGVVVFDEAYVDFAPENALSLALTYPHVLVARTFSKAYSLCFLRVGYLVGSEELIAALDKIRDSYNVNGLGQVAALETLKCLPYYRENFQKVISTRQHLSRSLAELGFEVFHSQTNFLLVRPSRLSASVWSEKLREHKILIRWFCDPLLRDFLRITIGTPEEAGRLVKAVKTILHRATKELHGARRDFYETSSINRKV